MVCTQPVLLEHLKLLHARRWHGEFNGRLRAADGFATAKLALRHVERFGGGGGATYRAEMSKIRLREP